MIQNLPTDFYWYLITIDDYPNMLNGDSFYKILKLIHEIVNVKFCIINSIEGAGKNWLIYTLQENGDKVYDIEYILKISKDIIQLDWGDFFLFKEYPNDWSNPKGEHYPYVVAPEKG